MVKSRLCIVPFEGPNIAPTTDKEQECFDELDDPVYDGNLSTACGWVIKVGQHLNSREAVREMVMFFRPHFPGREAINRALIGVCLKQV